MSARELSKLGWYRNRLRAMSAAETLHRAARTARIGLERVGVGLARHVPPPALDRDSAGFVQPAPGIDPACYVARAERVLAGQLQLLGHSVQLEHPVDWNRNPVSGHRVPMGFGKTLDYRDPATVGDIKYFWLMNRHHQLLHLAQAWSLTHASRYLDGIDALLGSWITQCSYPRGGNWTSSLELAIRLINWSAAWTLIGGAGSPLFERANGTELRADWLRLVYRHGAFISGHFSRHSSANNHLIGEAAGLFVAAQTWPFWDAAHEWGRTAREILEHEIPLQNAPDGVNREQSIFYQHFVMEFMVYAGLAADAARLPLSDRFWERFEAMLDFVVALSDVNGHLPMYGDADDALVLPLAPAMRWQSFDVPLTVGAVRARRDDLREAARGDGESCRWLLSESRRSPARPDVRARAGASRRFPDGGYYVLGEAFGTEREIRLVVDAGPLGYTSIAAHGHADALSLWLSVAGCPILIDPGTFAYQAQTQWREYFRSTAAHNTLQVDGVSQAVSGGKFLWLQHYRAGCSDWHSDGREDRVVGWHDGYLRLADPVRHERTVRYLKGERVIEVVDALQCASAHEVMRSWHFAPGCDVAATSGGVEAQLGDVRLRISADSGVAELCHGAERPISGWASERFGVKQPVYTARWRDTTSGPGRFTTRIEIV